MLHIADDCNYLIRQHFKQHRNKITKIRLFCSKIQHSDIIVMAALWNRAGHYIFILWFLILIGAEVSTILNATLKW